MDRSQELYVYGDQDLEVNLIDHKVTESSSVPETRRNYKRWLHLSIYVISAFFCQPLVTYLASLFYENGGRSMYIYMEPMLQFPGLPGLLLYRFFSRIRQPKPTDTTFSFSLSFTTLASVYMCTGLLVSAYAYLSSVGLLYLPVSTFFLILASQLAFAVFLYFLNSQKLTHFTINSLFLLTVSSVFLVVNTDTQTR